MSVVICRVSLIMCMSMSMSMSTSMSMSQLLCLFVIDFCILYRMFIVFLTADLRTIVSVISCIQVFMANKISRPYEGIQPGSRGGCHVVLVKSPFEWFGRLSGQPPNTGCGQINGQTVQVASRLSLFTF